MLLSKLLRHIIVYPGAAIRRERRCTLYQLRPLAVCQPSLEVCTADVMAKHGADESGVEVVAGADGAHGRRLRHRILLAEAAVREDGDGVRTVGVYKSRTVERGLGTVDTLCRVFLVEHFEVVALTAHYIGVIEVINKVWRHLHHVAAMRRTEIDVVVDDGAALARTLQQC